MKLKIIAIILIITSSIVSSLKWAELVIKQKQVELDYQSKQSASDLAHQKEIASLQQELKQATQPIFYEDRECLGEFKITYYDACVSCCGKTDGITASGAKVCPNVTVAVDPSVIPLGTYIYIEDIGYRVAQDTGGAIKGNRIDVYVHSHSKALELGTKTTTVWRMTE